MKGNYDNVGEGSAKAPGDTLIPNLFTTGICFAASTPSCPFQCQLYGGAIAILVAMIFDVGRKVSPSDK